MNDFNYNLDELYKLGEFEKLKKATDILQQKRILPQSGDISRAVTQDDVNKVYGEVFNYVKYKLELAMSLDLEAKIIIGEHHYAKILNEDNDTVYIADSDNVIVALCAFDAARRLGIKNFLIEQPDEGLEDLSKISLSDDGYDSEDVELEKLNPEIVSFVQYFNYAKKYDIELIAGDPLQDEATDNIEKHMLDLSADELSKLILMNEYERDEYIENKYRYLADTHSKRRERAIAEYLAITDGHAIGIYGANHVRAILERLNGNYYAPIILSSSAIIHPDMNKDIEMTIYLEKLVEEALAKRFIVDGISENTNKNVLKMVEIASDAFIK